MDNEDIILKQTDYRGLKDFMLNIYLVENIPSDYYFHNKDHAEDVLEAAEILAEEAKKFAFEDERYSEEILDEYEMTLLRTGAIMHDSGVSKSYKDHEKYSVEVNHEVLPKFGYSDEYIEKIDKIVFETELDKDPETILGKYLCDADTYNLGTNKFFEKSDLLRKELRIGNDTDSLIKWYISLYNFLENHEYYTETAKMLLNEGKKENIKEVERRITGIGDKTDIEF